MAYLPDVNIWLALTFESHVHHASAKAWFDGLPPEAACSFCRLTQQGFLRLATNPQAFGEEAVTLADAWRLYDALMKDSRVSYAIEPPGIEAIWRDFTVRRTFSPKVWNDAYMAAFASMSGSELVTFDQAFGQYSDVLLRILA